MTTSTTTAWFPTVAEIIDEAAERARIDPGTLTPAQQFSARRSINAIFTAWQNKGVRMALVQGMAALELTEGDYEYDLPADCHDILEASLRRNGVDVPMTAISRDVYMQIPAKTTKGRPDRYYVELLAARKLWIWQSPENDTDVIVYNYFRIPKDIKADMTNTPDMARVWFDALFDELAVRLHQKFGKTTKTDRDGNPYAVFDNQYHQTLQKNAAESYLSAKGADRQRVNTVISPSYRR